jgi:hypothetical protein
MTLYPGRANPPLGASARSAVREASPWIRALARLGYTAIGIVYIVMGGLAAQAALSPAKRPENSSGALTTIYDNPAGRAGITIVAVGLVGYVLWRLVSAIFDGERNGGGLKGTAVRIGYLGSALIYGSLALEATRLLLGSQRESSAQGDQQADHWTAMVLTRPLGRWVVAAVGGGVILFGLYQIFRAIAGNLQKRLDLTGVGSPARENIVRLGRFGYAARGTVFGIIGWFLVRAALDFDPEEAKDLASALQVLRSQPYGSWLLGAVALGLVSWGVWQLANGRYRRLHPA